ncbi:hypothetical protein BpHYR1_046211 [Brachionus plicatilis]|uniref:Uncharacterized protein n=1 Tax=Brachionus plicatilis TaxID=10195 RepID=A0A3M7SNH7_BRAPC|nr:hypothetical protein BpHYR1_046211 [Brachionus plicatilis]
MNLKPILDIKSKLAMCIELSLIIRLTFFVLNNDYVIKFSQKNVIMSIMSRIVKTSFQNLEFLTNCGVFTNPLKFT